jgi:hypothetical protein
MNVPPLPAEVTKIIPRLNAISAPRDINAVAPFISLWLYASLSKSNNLKMY